MESSFGFRMLWLFLIVIRIGAQDLAVPTGGIGFECLDNLVRLTLDKALLSGNSLFVDAINGTEAVPISDALASQCGYSLKYYPWESAMLFASVWSCMTHNQDDELFNVTLRLWISGADAPQPAVHVVSATCSYRTWASREILCDRNYMEVSVKRRQGSIKQPTEEMYMDQITGFPEEEDQIWKVMFYKHTSETSMTVEETHAQGYGLAVTPTRLVLRGGYNTAETHLQDVAGVPMRVLKTTTVFTKKWIVTLVDADIACPSGGLTFTEEMITWRLPRLISPLVSSTEFNILEVHMGIDGRRLDAATMAARNYHLSVAESHIVLQIPVGAVDGYYKSHVSDNRYHVTFTIEPMLEVLWQEDVLLTNTRYKVLFPITTPLMPRPLHVINDTVPGQKVFAMTLGTFLPDVELENLTFESELLSVSEANDGGFNVQEHKFPNGSKTFSLQVPFSDPVVLKSTTAPGVAAYTLSLTFGFLILPEYIRFSHPVVLEVFLKEVVLPTVTGTCDLDHFYITVEYGSQGHIFTTVLGRRELLPSLAQEYNYCENGTHFSITVPSLASDVVFELVQDSSVRSRLDVVLRDPLHIWKNFSLTCSFPMRLTECFPNGTMTALAVKVESVPNLNPSQLTLRDFQCKPVYSDDRFAYFSFNVNTCGTTRKFMENIMVYQNEISLWEGKSSKRSALDTDVAPVESTLPVQDPAYRFTAACYYEINATQTLAFSTMPQANELMATEIGVGGLSMRIRLSKDESYSQFYTDEDYPVVKYLQQPLYFEVELLQSTDPRIELFLDNCWATLNMDGDSLPKWDVIVDGCENLDDRYRTVFHPVLADTRVQFPRHFKRFEIKMFSFTMADMVQQGQIFVHCAVLLCDASGPSDGLCSWQCMNTQKRARRRVAYDAQHKEPA